MRKKKEIPVTDAPERQDAPVREKKARKAAATKKRHADGPATEDRPEQKDEYAASCKALAEIMLKHEHLLGEVKQLRMLLAAFNALTRDDNVKLEKPDLHTPYWYIRAMPIAKSFEVVPCQWNNWRSDHYRYVQGNMFLDLFAANTACQALNKMLADL